MTAPPIRVQVAREGQPYVHDEVVVEISRATKVALSVNAGLHQYVARPYVFGSVQNRSQNVDGPTINPRIEQFSHYEKVRLRWLKPDGKGGLVPR